MLDLYVYIPLFSFHDWLFLDNINKDGSSTQPSNTDVSCKLPLKTKELQILVIQMYPLLLATRPRPDHPLIYLDRHKAVTLNQLRKAVPRRNNIGIRK